MPRRSADGTVPNWSRLCRLAAPQKGYFTGAQARQAGFSPQLLQYYIQKSLVERAGRGILHLTQHPRASDEEMIALWLWSRREGIFSHETALRLHQLCDGAPAVLHLTIPLSWRKRRVHLPPGAAIYYGDVPPGHQHSRGPLSLTSPLRTLVDCTLARLDPELVEQATRHAIKRKLLTRALLRRALRAAAAPTPARPR